ERDPAMRWRAKSERAQQMTELYLLSFGSDAQRIKHFLLQRRLIDSHAAAAYLNAVQNDVVSFGPNLGKFLRLKQRHVCRFRSSEWMMHRVPFVIFSTPFEERKIRDPKKIPDFASRHELLHLCDPQTQSTKDFTGDFPLVGSKKNTVSLFDVQL